MDNYATCIIPTDNSSQSESALIFGGGTSDFFRLTFYLSVDNASELVKMIKLKTATSSGLISTDAITSIKNATAYISRERHWIRLVLLKTIEGEQSRPISDDIKNDFDAYDFTHAHMKYWKRSIYIGAPLFRYPAHYDLQRKLWQPPQTIPVSRLAIIGDWLYGHSAVNDET